MSEKMNKIKIHGITYHLDSNSGFWISIDAPDPSSATITTGELLSLVSDNRKALRAGMAVAEAKLKEWNDFLEYHS